MRKLISTLFVIIFVCLCSCSNFLNEYSDSNTPHGYNIFNTGTVGQTISDAYDFNNVSSSPIGITAIDSAHIALAYSKNNTGVIKIGTLSGTTVSSWSSEYIFNATIINLPQLALIDPTHLAVIYTENSTVKIKIGTLINPTTIDNNWSSAYVVSTSSSAGLSITTIDSSHLAVAYYAPPGYIKICTLSDPTTISSWSSEYNFTSTLGSAALGVILIDPTHLAVSYNDNSDRYGKIKIGTLSSPNVISEWSSEYIYNSEDTGSGGITFIDSNHIAVSYNDRLSPYYGKIKIGTLSGAVITDWSSAYVFNYSNTVYTGITLANSRLVVCYIDSDGFGKGKIFCYKAVIGDGTIWDPSWPSDTYEIKFGTDSLTGTGNPDIWFTVYDFISPAELSLTESVYEHSNEFLPLGTSYIIRQPY